MSSESAKRGAATTRSKHGDDFYARIGAIGGKNSIGGGFSDDPKRAAYWGKIGGKKSRRNWTDEQKQEWATNMTKARVIAKIRRENG